MKSRFWSSDWFAGLLITIVVVVLSGLAPFQSLERSFYDWGVRSTDRLPSDKISVIAIDDESIENIGRWPWPRDLHAELIDRLTEGGAKVVGQTVFFLEPQVDPGTLYIRELIEFFSTASFGDVPADIDALGAMLEFEGKNKAVSEILEFYLQSSMNTRLSQDIETLKSSPNRRSIPTPSWPPVSKMPGMSCSRWCFTLALRAVNRMVIYLISCSTIQSTRCVTGYPRRLTGYTPFPQSMPYHRLPTSVNLHRLLAI